MKKPAGHAFISYVREDSHEVDKLQRTLEAAGVSVWRDTADLWPGEDWRAKIRRAITDNALVFIACFSARSVARVKSYQNEELTLAMEQLRLRRPDDPWLIPVCFEDCQIPDLDLGAGRTLASIQHVDLFGDRRDIGIARLVRAVVRLLDQRPHERGTTEEETDERISQAQVASRIAEWSPDPTPSQEKLEPEALEWLEYLKSHPPVLSGEGSRVLGLDLPHGRYLVSWTAEGDGLFILYHEEAEHSIALTSGNVPKTDHSETVFRFREGGRHIFNVQADNLAWELTFRRL